MRLNCPRCEHVLEYSRVAPRFCSNCGLPLTVRTEPVADTPTTATSPPLAGEVTTVVQPVRAVAVAHPDQIGGYRLVRPLGGGGMGTVYEAEEVATGRHVALKLIRPEFADSRDTVERFRREGRLASTLFHPRCVFVFSADEDAGRPYIVMELMPGKNLFDLVEREGPLPVKEAVRKILDVIEGLQEAHRLGMIHRDIKPSNCFVDNDGRVKVGDFGLAKSLIGPEQLTRSGAFLGTILFASPEQIRNERVNHLTDVYSVCATLYYLLTTRAPFHHEDAAAALARTVTDPVPSMRTIRPDLPRTLDEIVLKGLQRSRRQRWQDLEELRLALLPFLNADSATADLGWRVSAYMIDLIVLIPLVFGMLAPARWLLPAFDPGLQTLAVSLLVGLLYFAVPEWLFGCSLGKFATRLRVRDAKTGDRPSLLRSLARTLCFYVFKDSVRLVVRVMLISLGTLLTLESDVNLTMRIVATTGLVVALPFVSSGIGMAILATTMRRRNGYRGIHEFLSGTRVIRLPLKRPRFRGSAQATWPSAGTLPAEVPARVSGYSVHAVANAGAEERLLQGADTFLHRPVWLWQRQADKALPAARRTLTRDTRPRWLASGSQDGWAWDAFVATAGCPLVDLVTPRNRLGWSDALSILEQLAGELEAAEKDGTLPDRLSPEQVWVQPSERILLLDTPPRQATTVVTPMDLLRQVAAVALEGQPRAASELEEPIRAPIPRPAAVLLTRLMGKRAAFLSLGEFREALARAHEEPAEISQPKRGLQVALTLLTHSPGLLFLFGLGPVLLLGAYLLCVLGTGTGEFKKARIEEELAGIEAGKPGADVAKQELDEELERLIKQMAQLHRDRETVLESWSWFMFRGLPRFEKELRQKYGERLEEFVDMGGVDEEAHGFDALLAHDDPLAGPSGLAREMLEEWWLVEGMLFWPVLWALWAWVTRGGLTWRLAGLTLVGADGRPAARWRCLLRSLVLWLPVALVLLAALDLDVRRVAGARDGWTVEQVQVNAWVAWQLWWGAVGLVGLGVFAAVCWPNRGLHDRLLGVYPVPR